MTPVRLGLLGLSIAALFGAVWLVFMAPNNDGEPSSSALAGLPTPMASAGASVAPGSIAPPTAATSTAPGATGSPAAGSPSPAATPDNPLAKQVPPVSADPEDLTGYIWPVRNALISSRFSPREASLGGFVIIDGKAYHDGVDLATRCGDKVRAAHDGTVLYAGRNFDPYFGYLGNAEGIYARLQAQGRVNTAPIVIVIDDGNGYRSVYVHLQEAIAATGDVVKAGDVIGLEGATGYATGCHLHYGMIRMDGAWQAVVARLLPFGYPPLVRERVNALRVLPWDDQYAPQALKDKINPPTPGPSPAATPESPSTNSPAPLGTPGPSPAPTT